MESVAGVWALGVQSALALCGAWRDYLPIDFSEGDNRLGSVTKGRLEGEKS